MIWYGIFEKKNWEVVSYQRNLVYEFGKRQVAVRGVASLLFVAHFLFIVTNQWVKKFTIELDTSETVCRGTYVRYLLLKLEHVVDVSADRRQRRVQA